MRFFREIIIILSLLILAPWPVAFAYDIDNDESATGMLQIEVAELSAKPRATIFGRTIGGIAPGDLFYIHADDYPADIMATLYLVNTEELIRCYRYMNLKVGVYVQANAGQWQESWEDGEKLIPDTYLTLHNGRVSFTLPSYAKYKITIDSGCYYSNTVNAAGGSVSPRFHLNVP